jgi:hypothetical protein
VPEGFGVNIHFTHPSPGEMERFAEAGYRLVRMDFGWETVEREPGRYDFTAYDHLMNNLVKVGARPIFILDYGHYHYDRGAAPHSEAARAAFSRFAAAAAQHFRGQGVLWEIWNEPNLSQFWKPNPDAQNYAQLAIATVRAMRAVDPKAVILSPGSSEFPWPFLETIFSEGLLEHVDAVSVHPYRNRPPETVTSDYGRLRALVARYASLSRRNLPIVSSEWGYSTAIGATSEEEQAQFLTRQWLVNMASGVNLSIFYDWRDNGDNPNDREHRFGTVRRNLEPKPSFLAAQNLIRSLGGFAFRHRLQGKSPSDWILLFQKGEEPGERLNLVKWSTDHPQTPTVTQIDNREGEANRLGKLACIGIPAGALAESPDRPASLELSIFNPEKRIAHVTAIAEEVAIKKQVKLEVRLSPCEHVRRSITLPPNSLRSANRSIELSLFWDDEPLPVISPLEAWQTEPLALTAAPRGKSLEIAIENPAGSAFTGKLAVHENRLPQAEQAVSIPQGRLSERVRMPMPTAGSQILLKNQGGEPVAQTVNAQYVPMEGFPARRDLSPKLDAVLFVENSPRAPRPLSLSLAGDDPPVLLALNFAYKFAPGWQYLEVAPRVPLKIPAEAREAVIWVLGNKSGDHLRCRIQDATGQTFQHEVANLTWNGWRPLWIKFDGQSSASHWGGANDGILHPPLAWEALLLIDSAVRDRAHSASISIASPFYVTTH